MQDPVTLYNILMNALNYVNITTSTTKQLMLFFIIIVKIYNHNIV
jgi:hypothetical protein